MIKVGNPRYYKIIKKYSDIIILQPMKQKTSKPDKSGIKQKSLKQIVLEGFAKQEERWEHQEEFNKMILDQFKKHKWI